MPLEDISSYALGGFHPVHIGDVFGNARYTVEHKLGTGASSTVWLARDALANRFVALKIHSAAASLTSMEARTLRQLARPRSRGILGFLRGSAGAERYFPALLDEFRHTGPNGIHTCIVMEACGPSVADLLEEEARIAGTDAARLDLGVGRRVAVQIARAVSKLHQSGVVHGGASPPVLMGGGVADATGLHLGKVLFVIPGMATWSPEKISYRFGNPRTAALPAGAPNAPRYLVASPFVSDQDGMGRSWIERVSTICYSDACIRIVGFGPAKILSSPAPTPFTPPEVLFCEAVSPASDVWSVACFFSSLFGVTETIARPVQTDIGTRMIDPGVRKENAMIGIVHALPPKTTWCAITAASVVIWRETVTPSREEKKHATAPKVVETANPRNTPTSPLTATTLMTVIRIVEVPSDSRARSRERHRQRVPEERNVFRLYP